MTLAIAVATTAVLAGLGGFVVSQVAPFDGLGMGTAEAAAANCTPVTRTYYVAADEVAWDYAPTNSNQVTGEAFGEDENVFVATGSDRIGHVYVKALYREYTDATFTTLKAVAPQWSHKGILGPILRGQVGDTIRVVFKNNAQYPYSIHPHGVAYDKAGEGAPYADGTSLAMKGDDAVAPGATYTYVWKVPERAGPGPMDPSSVVWMYHSHVDEAADTYAGLQGAIIVTKCGMAKADGSPKDVDREFVTLFEVMDENGSPYLDQNIRTYARNPSTVNVESDGFVESNLMHGINGYVYGNMPGLDAKVGQRVRWYTIGMGTEVDLHTPHWHGNTLLWSGMRTDMTELLPMSMKSLDMVPDTAGTWLFHCHVNDHIAAGMQATYVVT